MVAFNAVEIAHGSVAVGQVFWETFQSGDRLLNDLDTGIGSVGNPVVDTQEDIQVATGSLRPSMAYF